MQIILVAILVSKFQCFAQACLSCDSSQQKTFKSASVGGKERQDLWTIYQHVNEVMVAFTVTHRNKYIDDLAQNEISITDDGKPPVRVSAFGHQTDLPLRLGLLLDASDSVQHRFNFEKDAAARFLREIVRPRKDQAFVIGFKDESSMLQDYTDNPDQLAAAISLLHLGGETALYDAIRAACLKMAETPETEPTARILILLSDGEDNSSRSTLNEAIETAQRHQVTLYNISTNNTHFWGIGDHVMAHLAEETGGLAFFPDNAKETVNAFKSLEQEMRSRYVISYEPNDLKFNGTFRSIQIKAQRTTKKFHVHARTGYYAPEFPTGQRQPMGISKSLSSSAQGLITSN